MAHFRPGSNGGGRTRREAASGMSAAELECCGQLDRAAVLRAGGREKIAARASPLTHSAGEATQLRRSTGVGWQNGTGMLTGLGGEMVLSGDQRPRGRCADSTAMQHSLTGPAAVLPWSVGRSGARCRVLVVRQSGARCRVLLVGVS